MSRHFRLLGLSILPWLCLAGCGAGSGAPDASVAGAGVASATSAVSQARAIPGMSPGKPRAPVALFLEGELSPLVPGVPVSVTLVIDPEAGADGVELLMAGSGGIDVLAPGERMFLGPARAGEALRVPMQLVASGATPLARLEALVTIEAGGERQSRAVSLNLPLQGLRSPATPVATPAAGSFKAEPVLDSTGELIHSMQAETILN